MSFNVLDRTENLDQSYLLEASAGTGKTFAIENIVVRLLLDSQMSLDQILVVTFTKAATRDLKLRIRQNIQKALEVLQGDQAHNPSDYLLAFQHQEPNLVQAGINRLEDALFIYDQAQIFTIHGFCARILKDFSFEGGLGFNSVKEDSTLSEEVILTAIRDFFRTELKEELLSPVQLKILLTEYDQSIEKLERALLKIISGSSKVISGKCFKETYHAFFSAFKSFQEKHKLRPDWVFEDFLKQAPCYEKTCDRQGNVKNDVLKNVKAFVDLFHKDEIEIGDFNFLIKEGVVLVDILDASRLKKRASLPEHLHYPDLVRHLREAFYPIVEEARQPHMLFALIAAGCQTLLNKRMFEEELLSFDELLRKMSDALKKPSVVTTVRNKYRNVIIDEFQDTDPIQWKIFDTLFPANADWGNLYLVGDPKQSIYAFRQADIYTYLAASEALGADAKRYLDTNYRSQPSLVTALNALFGDESIPKFLSLPKIGDAISYHPVKANPAASDRDFADAVGSVHFCIAAIEEKGKPAQNSVEEEFFFPYFLQEIARLNLKNGIALNQSAILVSDRFQADRVVAYLKKHKMPVITQRTSSLRDSLALPGLRDLLYAVLHPKDESVLRVALGGSIIQWSPAEILQLNETAMSEETISSFVTIQHAWRKDGFSACFDKIMDGCWGYAKHLAERILSHEEGLELYQDLLQLSEILSEFEYQFKSTPEQIIAYLDRLMNSDVDVEILKRRQDLTKNAVTVMTIHASKGLEFDIVFALGLISRSKAPALLIPTQNDAMNSLKPVVNEDAYEYINHCYECDAEKMRQLYVSMTRAKYRLYLPVIIAPNGKKPELGSASPMELYLSRLGYPPSDHSELYERIGSQDGRVLKEFVQTHAKANITLINLQANSVPSFIKKPESHELSSPKEITISTPKLFMHSFTGLTKGLSVYDDESVAPHDFQIKEKTTHTLPAGAAVGVLLHEILEKVCYEAVSKAEKSEDILPLITPFLHKTEFELWADVIAKIVFTTLKMPLREGKSCFQLCQISKAYRMHEVEFLYPYQGIGEIEEMTKTDGFLKGFIDALFYHEGKYYLVDWKSNWLGQNGEDYHIKNLEKAMEEHHYFLQATVYTHALQRYLKLFDARPFKEIFGGAYYIFLRGPAVYQGQRT